MKRRFWPALVALAVALVALVVVVAWRSSAPRVELLLVPSPGQALPLFLSDGHPVWVIGHEDGSSSVLDAFSTHVPYSINKLTWWCDRTRVIDDPFHGSFYDEWGDKLGGPAPSGLREYPTRIEQGQLRIAGPSRARPLPQSPSTVHPPHCTYQEALFHDFTILPAAASPADAAAWDAGVWQRVHGSLLPRPERHAGLLCPGSQPEGDCVEIALSGMEDYVPGPGDQFSVRGWTNVDWLVRAENGRLVEIALIIPHS